jgi:hypothetical protein
MAITTGGPAPFVQQLHRAAAQRGRLDPLYQDLSEQLTRILQRLYPVWALIGPGLSDPGHIELHSRWIYLDSEALLGSRATIQAGAIPRRHVLRTFGVALHETFHGKHTKRWALERDLELARSADPAKRQLAADRRLLEEPRMEAHGCRDFPADSTRGRFTLRALQAAVVDLMLPHFAAELLPPAIADRPVTRDLAGRAAVYLRARTLYGAADPHALTRLEPIWRAVLGDTDQRALDALFARLIWIGDGNLDALDAAARAYRDIIGPPDPEDSGGSPDGSREEHAAGAADGAGGEATASSADGPGPAAGNAAAASGPTTPSALTLQEALEHAIADTRERQLVQLDHEIELQALLDEVAHGANANVPLGRGRGTGSPAGRMPDRGVDRPPLADEVAQARRYATRMRQAITHGSRTIDKRTPGGRFDGRAYARSQAQRAHGRPVSTHPWQITRHVHAPIEAPHVALIIDTSDSMGALEYALGPLAWIISDGLRQIGGRCAIALFGSSAALLSDGRRPLRLVPGIRTGGGTAFAGDALVAATDELDMTSPRRPRLCYIVSDGVRQEGV